MSRPFAKYPAKPAFGQIREPLDAGEYIQNKKIKYSFCASNICHSNNIASYPSENVFEHDQLYSNLYTQLDLSGNVLVIANLSNKSYPAAISETLPAPLTYYIDLSGNLFGNTVCGINNYQKYIVNSPPYQNNNPDHINNL